ncbi:tetratricopeptide repeat protein [Leptolyngbya sp. AN02str]|uniref:tetratricopeptide repeat protein n=1 Tax=Leptolyngbya sp. AN02str TaxID=3423363 RepID=UPI003D317EC3
MNHLKPLLRWIGQGFIGVVSSTWVTTSLVVPSQASTSVSLSGSSVIAQVSTPNSPIFVTGQLDQNSPTLTDGRYYQAHTFEGRAEEQIVIELSSEEFDTYLIVISPENEIVAGDDDGGAGTNSTLMITLPSTGVYTIVAIASGAGTGGDYRLERRAATVIDQVLAEVRQLNRQVVVLKQAGRYADAIPLAERLLSIYEQVLGGNHPDVTTSLNDLALLYQDQGNYIQAEPLFQRSLTIREQALGADHPHVASSLNNLASLYQYQGNYAQAEPLYRRALSIWEQVLGADHPHVAFGLNNLASLYIEQGNYTQAEPLYQRSIAIGEQVLGADHPDVAASLNNLAELYRAQGNYAQAELLFQRSLAIREQALGGNHPDVATSLNNLARLYQDQGNYAQAEPLYRRALSIWEQVLGADHPHVAFGLNNLAGLYMDQGNYTQPEPFYKRSLSILEQALGGNHPHVALSLSNLALLYQEQGNYTQAEPFYKRSLSILEQALGGNHPHVALSLSNLALLYQEQGNYAQAEPLFQRSLAIREQALGANHPDVANSLNNLASLYQEQGNYAQAEPLFQRSLAIREQALGANHPDVANSLNNLANLYRLQGDYTQAEPLYMRSFTILEQALGTNHPNVATSLNNLASLYYTQANYIQAEPLYIRSFTILEQALGTNHPNVAASLTNLAQLYYAQGNYAQAELLLQRALSILEQTVGANHPFVATSLITLAALYQDQGNYDQAKSSLQQSLAIFEPVLGINHPFVATNLNNLARLHQDQGNYAQAELLYQRSLSIREQVLGANHPDVAQSLTNLAAFLWAQNNLPSTLGFLQRGLAVEEANLNLNLMVGSEAYKQSFLSTFAGTTSAAISLHLQSLPDNPTASQLALTTVLQRKGRLLDLFTNSQQILREQLDLDSQTLLSDLTAKRTQLSTLVFNRPESLSLEQYRTQVANLEAEIQSLEAQLSRRSSQFQALNQPIDIPTIQALLPAQTALVELVRYRVFAPQASINNRFGEARYAAYLLQADGIVDGLDLGPAAEIDPLIEDLQRSLGNYDDQGKPGFTVEQVKEAAQALDARVMAPIRARLGDTNHLLISPDGAFNLIPFETLVDETGRYLVENYTLTYLTSGRDLLRLQAQATAAPQSNPVLLANPFFENSGNADIAQTPTRFIDLRERAWPPLMATAEEADAIATQLAQTLRLPPSQILNLQQQAATEAALRQVNRPRILHIATHGFFESLGSQEVVLTDNPLLRSGLVLSGVNVGQSGTGEDGIVSALEVSNLNLLGTQLVALSACDTGLGDLSLGEGVYGLRRALVLAGSQSQLISLWQVQDNTTRDLMVEYYQNLLSGMGRSEALRQTQLAMLNQEATAHPYYWAPFINSGDWRPISPQ